MRPGTDLAGGYACSIPGRARGRRLVQGARADARAAAAQRSSGGARRRRRAASGAPAGGEAAGSEPTEGETTEGETTEGIDRRCRWGSPPGRAPRSRRGRVGGAASSRPTSTLLGDHVAGDVFHAADGWRTPRVEGASALVERYLNLGDDRNVAAVWVLPGARCRCTVRATTLGVATRALQALTAAGLPDGKRAAVAVRTPQATSICAHFDGLLLTSRLSRTACPVCATP